MSDQPLAGQPAPLAFPDFGQLRNAGWCVGSVSGQYVVAWRGAEEVVLTWRGGEWRQVSGRVPYRPAA